MLPHNRRDSQTGSQPRVRPESIRVSGNTGALGVHAEPNNHTSIVRTNMIDDTPPVTGPLHGLRVIDWTMWQFGPVSTMMLADMGAEVIKIESLDGDHGRHFESIRGRRAELDGDLSAYFEGMNRQKLGMALNLKTQRGVEIMQGLVKRSDVLVQNFRKGVAERLGLSYDDLVKHNPKLIYASASGYGPEGPDANKPAFALTAEARSGALWWFGPDDDTPHELDIADQIAGMMLSYGVLGPIVYRERFGVGQKVDVSHLGSMIWARGMQNGISFLKDFEVPRFDRKAPGQVLWNYYRCGDGEWLAFSMGQGDRYWPVFCQAIDRPDLATDPRFTNMTARFDNRRDPGPGVRQPSSRLLGAEARGRGRSDLGARAAQPGPARRSTGDGQRLRDRVRPPRDRSVEVSADPGELQRNAVVHSKDGARPRREHRADSNRPPGLHMG
ncbi:MAG: carnitine dehydratase [Chloroflexi bacterium]|nr:carnitine dehydratase [Chloroflexota bacterium]